MSFTGTTLNISCVTGTGTASYLTKWTGTGTVGASTILYDNGTRIGIGTTSPTHKLKVVGGSVSTDSTFISTIGTGQAPLVVTSQTLCTNLNANYLGSHLASYFQTALTNPVTGTGTANYITEWSGANTLKAATSIIYDNGDGWVGIGTNGPAATLDVEEPAYEDYQQSVLADVDGSPISGIGSWDGDVALFTSLNGDYTGAVYLSSYDDNYSKLYGVASVDKNATNYF